MGTRVVFALFATIPLSNEHGEAISAKVCSAWPLRELAQLSRAPCFGEQAKRLIQDSLMRLWLAWVAEHLPTWLFDHEGSGRLDSEQRASGQSHGHRRDALPLDRSGYQSTGLMADRSDRCDQNGVALGSPRFCGNHPGRQLAEPFDIGAVPADRKDRSHAP